MHSKTDERPEDRLDALWNALQRPRHNVPDSVDARVIRRLASVARARELGPADDFVQRLRRQIVDSGKERRNMISGFHHVVLFCTDTERSREWYAKAGFEYNRGYGGMHWFNAGPYELMLHPAESGPAGHSPHIHVATPDVDRMFARARGEGLRPLDHQQPDTELDGPVTRPWGDREFELEDPDGNRIVITQS